jgi:DNA-binding GntR family transcriptional regulator
MMSTKPLLAVSLVEMIAADLQTKIIDEEFRAGDRLVIDSIARLYNVSLVPVREALVRLHTQGLLTFVPNVGYRIAPALSAEDLDKLFEARVVIEAGALRSAVRLGTPPDVGHLRELNDRMARDRYETRNYASFRQFIELNDAFHRGLVMLSDNNFLVKAYDTLRFDVFAARAMRARNIAIPKLIVEHEEILTLLEAGSEAALLTAIARHIMGSRASLTRSDEESGAKLPHDETAGAPL